MSGASKSRGGPHTVASEVVLQAVHSHSTSEDALTNDRLVHPRRCSPSIGPGLEDCRRPGRRQLAEHLANWVEGDVAEGDTKAELGSTPTYKLGDQVGVDADLESSVTNLWNLKGVLGTRAMWVSMASSTALGARGKRSSVREAGEELQRGEASPSGQDRAGPRAP